MKPTYKKLIVLVLLTILSLELVFLANNIFIKKEDQASSASSFSQKRKQYEQSIERIGEKKTFESIKNTKYKSSLDGHNDLHLFGEVLFDKKGIDALSICDTTFGFGCYHGFFIAAIATSGISVLEDADKKCLAMYGEGGFGCQHGIGHGIMEYYGGNRVGEALAACSSLSQENKIFGCQDGVFMEYNSPTATSLDDKPRGNRFNSSNPYFPCDTVPEKNRLSCYYNLPSFLLRSSFDETGVGELCAKLLDSHEKKICYLGIGHAVSINSDFNLGKTIEVCGLMDSDKNKGNCLAGASWTFFSEPSQRHNQEKVCEGLSKGAEIECFSNWNMFEIYEI